MTGKSGLLASMLAAAAMTMAPMSPALALPMVPQTIQKTATSGDVVKVQNRRDHRRKMRRHFRRHDGRA